MTRCHPSAEAIDVTLVKSARGTAGAQGVRDMLTDRSRSPLTRVSDCNPAGQAEPPRRAFALPTAETVFLSPGPASPAIRTHTLFDTPAMNRSIRALRGLRSLAPPLYRLIRNLAAAAKSRQVPPADERIRLVAVATAADGAVLGCTAPAYASDYGASAAAVTALADLACSGALRAGAGHSAQLTDCARLSGHACLQRMVAGSGGVCSVTAAAVESTSARAAFGITRSGPA